MHGWARVALWAMVILGIPCALGLWIDFCLGPLRRFVWRRVARIESRQVPGRNGADVGTPPRTSTPRGGER